MTTKAFEKVMTRIELIALFSALSKLCETENFDSVKEVINEVLEEARKKD